MSFTLPHVMQLHASHLSQINGIKIKTWGCKGRLHAIMHTKMQSPPDSPLQNISTSDPQAAAIDGMELA